MAEFNPFDIPNDDAPVTPDAAPRPQPGPPRQPRPPRQTSATVEKALEKLPKNGFGRFIRRFWRVCAIVVALVLVLAVFGSAIMMKLAPAWSVQRGVAKAADAIAARIQDSPYQALDLLLQSVQAGSVGCDFTLTQDGETMSGQVELTSQLKDRSFALRGAVSAMGIDLDGELFVNDTRAALRSSLLDDCYGVTYKSFGDDLRASAVPDKLGLSEDDILDAEAAMDSLVQLLEANPKGLLDDCKDVSRGFLKDLDFSSSTEKVKVGGERVSCKTLTANIGARDIRALILDEYDALTENETFRSLFTASALRSANDPALTDDQLDEQFAQQREILKQQLEQVDCDLDVTYCLYRGRLVKTELSGKFGAGGSQAKLECAMDFGCDPAKDDWSLTCSLVPDYGEAIKLRASYESELDGDDYSDCLRLTLGEDGGEQQVTLATDWDKATGDLTLRVRNGDDGSGGGEAESIHCNLQVDGSSFTLTLTPEDLGGEGPALTIRADSEAKLEEPKFVNLDKWDEDVLDAMKQAFQDVQKIGVR